MKHFHPLILVLVVLMIFSAGCAAKNPAVQESILERTAQPQQTPEAETGGSVPVLGILVLLAPGGWMVWHASHEKKLKKVRAACCVPVMDEGQPGMRDLK